MIRQSFLTKSIEYIPIVFEVELNPKSISFIIKLIASFHLLLIFYIIQSPSCSEDDSFDAIYLMNFLSKGR